MILRRRPSPIALRRMAATYTPQVVAQLQQIEADLGGRGELIGLLALAPLNPDLEYVLGLLGDPQSEGKSLAEICGLGGILPGDLLKHLEGAALLRGRLLATQQIGKGIANVIGDIMRRAAPYDDACGTCVGTGTYTPEPTKEAPNPTPLPCETCKGSGVLTYRPDLDRQKLAVDLAHLLPRSGGIQIAQINQNTGAGAGNAGASPLSTFDGVQRVIDQILYGKDGGLEDPDNIPEAEVVDPPEGSDV